MAVLKQHGDMLPAKNQEEIALPSGGKSARTNDYDLRRLVVRAILDSGIQREAIKHEITLDTSSSDGRADIVVALDRELIGIEIKSGKDKLGRLETQREQYRRRFDRMCLVLDARHLPKDEVIRKELPNGGYSEYQTVSHFIHEIRFGSVAIARDGALENAPGSYRDLPWGQRCGWDTRYGPSQHQAPAAMLSLLWAKEALSIAADLVSAGKIPPAAGSGGARCRVIPHLAEHASITLLRPRIAASLRERQLNRWEEAFWKRFDAEALQE